MTFELEAELPERGVELALRVAPRETVALLGPNGAGKSTALAVAAGLLRRARRRVVLDGRPLTVTGGSSPEAAYVPPHARRIALLAQDPLLFSHLDVRTNVEFAPRAQGAGRAVARAAVADRVVVLEEGRVVEEGPTSEVLSRPRSAFAARIAGLNILTGTWREGRVHTDDGSAVAGMSSEPVPGTGERAVAVFSPGAVSVYREAPGGSRAPFCANGSPRSSPVATASASARRWRPPT